MAEKRTEYGEVINKKVLGQLHNSPKHNFTVQYVAGGGSGDFDIKGLLERTITEAVVPEDVTSIGDAAFSGCISLTSIELPNVTSIGDAAFSGCTSLTSIELPKVTNIRDTAFYVCTFLTSIELPNVTIIGQDAFNECTSLTSIELPNAISIGRGAFGECSALESVVIKNLTPPMIGSRAFDGCHEDLKIYVPASAVDTYKAASGWSTYADKIEAIQE